VSRGDEAFPTYTPAILSFGGPAKGRRLCGAECSGRTDYRDPGRGWSCAGFPERLSSSGHEDGGWTRLRKALVCGYHGWAYKLDGRLDYIPDAHGFPGFEKEKHGLVPVTAAERHGLVFVTQEESVSDGPLADYPEVLKPHQELVSIREFDFEMNWKLFAEAGMEGYHIKVGHPKTFYPYGFDNLNVVEPFGPNSRVTFPFRRIEKLRDVPREERKIDGKLTYAYQIFPNLLMAKLSRHTTVQFAEPVSPSRTKYTNYYISNDPIDGDAAALAEVKKDIDYVSDTGVAEDRDITMEIQKGLASGANEHFVYGHFEAAIVHFHKVINELMPKVGWEE
ncbi:MAG: SRPBCC family protein, partial [Pseudomonadota bacterium]|nr:SRPBCC family protein [Pseudomonadota bacterium]